MGCGSSKTTVYDDTRPTLVVEPEQSLSGASIVQCSGCGNLYTSAMNTAFCKECTFKLERAARQQSMASSSDLESSTSLTRPIDYESDRDDAQSDGLEITELDDNMLSVPASKSGQGSIIRIMYTIPEVSEENSREVTPAPSKYNQILQTMISVTVEDQDTGYKEEIFKQVALNDQQTSQIMHSTSTSINASQSKGPDDEVKERQTDDCKTDSAVPLSIKS